MLTFFLAAMAAEPNHLFILSGQSNMENWDPDKKFAPTLKKQLKPDDFWILKVAHGGTAIHNWVEEWPELAAEAGVSKIPKVKGAPYFDEIMKAYHQGVKEHGAPTTVTLVWAQGEADARRGFGPAYGAAFDALIARLTRETGVDHLNVVVSRLSDWTPSAPAAQEGWAQVRRAHWNYGSKQAHAAWVDADDLNDMGSRKNPEDDIHYTKKGYKILARRLALQAAALAKGEAPSPHGKPK